MPAFGSDSAIVGGGPSGPSSTSSAAAASAAAPAATLRWRDDPPRVRDNAASATIAPDAGHTWGDLVHAASAQTAPTDAIDAA